MGTIAQKSLFSWKIVERSSEILRVKRVLDVLPDEELITALVRERRGRRDDYPLELIWNTIIAGVVCGHESIAALRRELRRNGELREVCGFDPLHGETAVPPDYVYSRFLEKLFRHGELIDRIFARLVDRVAALLEDFGVDLAVDGKALPTYGRKDGDAAWGKKVYKGKREDGTPWEKVVKWFGYKLHLVVDAKYELPVAWDVTAANEADTTHLLPLIEQIEQNHPEIEVELIDITDPRAVVPEVVFATPTYMLDDRIVCLGNPSPEQVTQWVEEAATFQPEP